MSPRPYQLGRRQEATEQTRSSILAAARELLMTTGSFSGFTVDAVARQAGVARMTVYYQFGSKVGLLEALTDDLATRGQMDRLASAFRQSEPLDTLAEFITTFGRFWSTDRLITRRLRALAALDADFAHVVRARDERRREGARVIVSRLTAAYGKPAAEALDEAVAVLYTLTAFETFDTLIGPAHEPVDVAPLVNRIARAALGLDGL
ncbi:MAG TPA: helix-turn-helix domain-containing protein [Ktedonobacterales bacterium]|nr:helix-turn-helix domain-containing protein [Ktedonobacterales bacterium]